MTANPPARGLLYATATVNAAGNTVLTVACDCATVTDITIEGLRPGVTQEFAVTCDGCHTVRWFTATGPETP